MKKFKSFIKEILSIFYKPEMRILPGNIAFFIVLSIIPILTLFGVIASGFNISISSAVDFLNNILPHEVAEVLVPFVSGKGFDVNILIFMTIGFFVASNGPYSIIVASNTLYKFDDRNSISRRVKAFLMTIVLVFLVIFVILVLGFGNNILNMLLEIDIFKNLSNEMVLLFNLIKWPIAFFLIFFLIKVIYTMAPDKRISSKYMNRGSLFTTIGVILLTLIFSFYTSNIANYDLFYGGLSNIIILMIWFYLVSIILIMGIILNTYTYEKIKS